MNCFKSMLVVNIVWVCEMCEYMFGFFDVFVCG